MLGPKQENNKVPWEVKSECNFLTSTCVGVTQWSVELEMMRS